MLRLLRQWFAEAGWALVLVFLVRWITMRLGVRQPLDPFIHGLGGFAMAYFLERGLRRMEPYLGDLRNWTRLLMAFALTLTVALFWEFGEWASDVYRGTHIQFSVTETLGDLLSGTVGAALSLSLIAGLTLVNRRSPR